MIDRVEFERAMGLNGHPGYDSRSLHGMIKELDFAMYLLRNQFVTKLSAEHDAAMASRVQPGEEKGTDKQ